MVDGSMFPVVAGLGIGIAFVVIFSIMLQPASIQVNEELILKYSELPEVKYFLDKYPEAKATVKKTPIENYFVVSYTVDRRVEPPSELYTGINSFAIEVNSRNNLVWFDLNCYVHQGMTIGATLTDTSLIDEAGDNCFQGIYPIGSQDYLREDTE